MRLPHMVAFPTQVSGLTFDFATHLTNPNPPFEPCCPEDLLTLYLKPPNSICKTFAVWSSAPNGATLL